MAKIGTKSAQEIRTLIKNLTDEERELTGRLIERAYCEQWKTTEEDFWRYVYVMKCGDYSKIGITSNLSPRLNQVQCGNPYEVEIIFGTKHPQAELIEKELHQMFSDKRHKREWFKLEDGDIHKIQDFINHYA